MPNLTISEAQVEELAKQLPAETRRALALALLRDAGSVPDLGDLRQRSRGQLAAAFKERGLDIDRMSPDDIDQAIRQICQEQ